MLEKCMEGWKQKVDCYNEVVSSHGLRVECINFEKARNSLPTLQGAT